MNSTSVVVEQGHFERMLATASTGIQNVLGSWQETKLFLKHSVAFSQDSLHVIASVLVFLASAALFRKPLTNLRPWVAVLILAILNEFADLWLEQWPSAGMQYGESVRDLLLTMFLPTVLLIWARYVPLLDTRNPHDGRSTNVGG